MKLYYSKGACSLSPHIILNELNIPCQFESVDLKSKTTSTGADFLAVNPKGAVPTLLLDNEEILTENISILQYLADNFSGNGLLPSIGDFQRYHVIEWLSHAATDLHKSFGPLFNPQVPQDIKEQIFIPALIIKFDHIDKRLSQQAYIAGENYSLADAYIFVLLRWFAAFKIDLSRWQHIMPYFETIKARPAVQKAMKEEGLL